MYITLTGPATALFPIENKQQKEMISNFFSLLFLLFQDNKLITVLPLSHTETKLSMTDILYVCACVSVVVVVVEGGRLGGGGENEIKQHALCFNSNDYNNNYNNVGML